MDAFNKQHAQALLEAVQSSTLVRENAQRAFINAQRQQPQPSKDVMDNLLRKWKVSVISEDRARDVRNCYLEKTSRQAHFFVRSNGSKK